MKKKIVLLSFSLILSALLIVLFTFSTSAETNGYYTYTVSNGDVTITDVSTSISGNVTIPATLGGYPVTSIGSSAFRDCTRLASITMPESIKSIGASAFAGCSGLTSVKIGKGVTSIGNFAFEDCRAITSIAIPKSVTSVGKYAFEDCTGLTEVHIDDLAVLCGISFGSPNANPLYYAKKLYLEGALITELVIPESVTSIGSYAFYNCKGLTSITIPDSVESIGASAFYACSSLESITIPFVGESQSGTSNTHFGYIFGNYNTYVPASLKTVVITGGKSIASSAFSGCAGITSITMPESVVSIGKYAFEDCTGLTSIAISDSVTSIGNYAFRDCTGLTSITIPNSVESIGASAFYGCSSLESITIPFVGASKSGTSNTSFAYIFGSYNVPASLKTVVITGATTIAVSAFSDCAGLASITIPESVTSIGSNAFYGCTGLRLIIVNSSSIAKQLASSDSCGYLVNSATTVVIPSEITQVGAFVKKNFTCVEKVLQNGKAVTLYSNHSHASDSSTWVYPTCTAPSTACTVCGCTADPLGHNMADATCIAPSSCTRCDHTEGDPLGHDKVTHDAKAPTCTDIGWGAYETCSRCDYTTYAEKSALGHDKVTHDAKAPTCTDIGWGAYETCSRCDYTTYAEKPATGHNHEKTEYLKWALYTCTACGDSYREELVFRPVKLSTTAFNTAWGNEFVTELMLGEEVAAGEKIFLSFDSEKAALVSALSDVATVEISEDGYIVLTLKEESEIGAVLATLTFKTSDLLAVGAHTFLFCVAEAETSFAPIVIYEIGDVNTDGAINAMDALLVKQHLVEMITLDASQLVYADTCADGVINALDAMYIEQYVVEMRDVLGDFVKVTFVNEDGEEQCTVKAGAPLTTVPAAPQGYAWSETEHVYTAPDFVAILTEKKYYLVKEEG